MSDSYMQQLQRRIQELEVIEAAYHQLLQEQKENNFTRVLYNITTTLNQMMSLDAVLDLVLHYVHELVECDAASVVLLDGDMAEFTRFRSFNNPKADNVLEFRLPLREVPSIAYMQEHQRYVIIDDTTQSPLWNPFTGMGWIRSVIGAPIRHDGVVIGFIFVDSAQKNAFTPKQAECLQALADHTAIALQNARIFDELVKHADELQALRELSSLLYSTFNLKEVLDRLVGYISRTIDADAINIMFLEGDMAQVVAEWGYEENGRESLLGRAFPLANLTVLDEVVKTKRPKYTEDTQKVENWAAAETTSWIKSHLAAPIVYNDEVIGCINLDAIQPYRFRQIDLVRLQAFADTASAAVYHTRLYEQLQEREAILRQLAESVDEIFWVVDVQSRQLLYSSPLVQQMFGFTLEDIFGKLDKLAEIIHPSDRTRLLQQVSEIQAELAANVLSAGTMLQFRIYRAQDNDLRWVLVTLYPLYNQQGEIYRVVGVAEDITEQRVQMKRYEALFEQSNDAIVLMDLAGNYIACNQRAVEFLGLERREDVLKLNFRDVTAPEEIPDAEDKLMRLLTGERLPVYERTLQLKDGRRIPVEVNLELVQDEGKPLHIQSIFRDISMRKQFEAQRTAIAVEQERMRLLRDIVRSLSHDFRTPISTINTSVYLLKHSPLDERQHRQIEKLERQVERLTQLVDSLFSLTTWEEQSEMVMEQHSLKRPIQTAINTLRAKATEKRHIIETNLAQTPIHIQCDIQALAKALVYVLDNAIQFTPEGGTIIVRSGVQNGRAFIEIEDNGIGIEKQYLPHIFTPFFRTDESRNTETGGLGVGLTIVRQIIDAHNGRIHVESELGQGTLFRITLPIVD